jgi:hypothetical protein
MVYQCHCGIDNTCPCALGLATHVGYGWCWEGAESGFNKSTGRNI